MGCPRRVRATAVALVAALGATAAGPGAAPADIGTRDFSYAPLGGSPTGPGPESRLWFADGAWWATMYQPAAGGHRIFRLNRSFQIWSNTGTAADERADTRADTLWDPASGKLYIASHPVAGLGGPGGGARLYRFGYDAAAKRFTRDAGFPVAINEAAGESLTIDQDSTGRLWATWTQGDRVLVNHTSGSDAAWGTPYVVPGSGALAGGDLSALVRFGGDRIGVLWSEQAAGRTWFAVHADGAGDDAGDWSLSTVPTGTRADDHVSLRADGSGRVYAALETAETAPGAARVLLAERSPSGAWSTRPVATVADDVARPIVQLDEQHGVVHVVMTCGGAGGHICEKTAPVAGGPFPAGRGTPIIRQDGVPGIDDATSTKGSLDGATGLVVLAAMASTATYWHTDLPLGGAPAPVTADFAAVPPSGPAPLTVAFRDTSAGSPTHWRWDFGDGTTSYARNPSHTFRAVGRYTVRLVAARASSTSFRTRVGAVTVTAAGRGGPGPATRPSAGELGTTARRGRFTVTVRSRGLGRGRVRLSGTVRPRLSRTRIALEVRSDRRRWSLVRRARLRALSGDRSSFAFVVRRRARGMRYRVVLPAGTGRPRVATRSLLVRGRRGVR
jgi:PKD domain